MLKVELLDDERGIHALDEIQARVEALSADELDEVERAARGVVARSFDSPEGFDSFYRVVFGRPLPEHALKEWIAPAYAARAEGLGTVIEAFRGSTKTTTLTVAFTAFRIGHEPHKSNLLIQVGDDIAKDSAQQIADIIATNPGWKLCFPQVVPDYEAGWGANGYEVMRIDMEYEEWRQLCAQEKAKDPTFVGLGYKSRAIIGKHPTGMLVVDDIHDEHNTRSARELDTVIKVVTGTIMPTVTPATWTIFIGTPWAMNDVLAYVKATGRFKSIRTPILRPVSSRGGVRDASPASRMQNDKDVEMRDSDLKVDLQATERFRAVETPVMQGDEGAGMPGRVGAAVWPEVFNSEEIEKQRMLAGEVEFARMFLLDLEAASGAYLKREWLHEYPHEKIEAGWAAVMGVDYASTADQLSGSRRDYFAVAIGRVIPGGQGVVLTDGFRGRVSQGEAEQRLKALASMYPTLQLIGVEAVGKGEEFYHLLLRTSLLPLMPLQTGGKTKGQRFERGMAPLFEYSRAFVADVETPFLRAFRDEWVRWPHGEHDDTLDAAYWMLYVARNHLIGGRGAREHGGKRGNPFASLGRA